MKSTKISTVLSFFRRGIKASDKTNYGWYNMGRKITTDEVNEFKRFASNHKSICLCCIVIGISSMRPQRTWGGLPEFIRGSDEFYSGKSDDGTFIFMWWGPWSEVDPETYTSLVESVIDQAKNVNGEYTILNTQNL